MKSKTISSRVHIPLESIENLLYSARQGTAYWVGENEDEESDEVNGLGLLEYESEVKNFMKGELEIYVFDDDNKKHILNIAKIKKGLSVMARQAPVSFGNILTDNTDMYTADALVQCALFGKIIYS